MDVTAHIMVKNEEFYIVPVLESVLQAGFREVIVADCGSMDRTWDILQRYISRVRLLSYGSITPEENGQVRQHMTNLTRTPWCMLVDGDEYYWPRSLKGIVGMDMPAGKRFGFTTLANVQKD
ncbi:MAG: glycosyltransferase, partial [Dehalococcoidales bacterium]|nr:glycosyltransferase [Dehalococcoidales bacterium]